MRWATALSKALLFCNFNYKPLFSILEWESEQRNVMQNLKFYIKMKCYIYLMLFSPGVDLDGRQYLNAPTLSK